MSKSRSGGGGGGEALESNMMGKCLFFMNLHNLLKKICISITCFGIIRLENNRENDGPLFLNEYS